MAYENEGRKAIFFGTDVAKFDELPLSVYQPKSRLIDYRNDWS